MTGTLGAGAMGEVHLAVDEVLGREVAVKTLKGGADGLAAHLLDERFRQEARAIAQLAHPGVVQVFDIDLRADPPYLVMERVSGPSLKERLAERPLSDRELRALGIQIANALAAAHAAGIVHRDVKPANILFAGEGTWKLADFGVAHVPDSSLTMTGQFVGSPAYAPPEALLRGQLGPAGDIYGLGATLYQAVAGRWPRADGTSGALFAPVPPLAMLAPHVSPQLADAIDRAVALEPDTRPSASELASALARAATQPSASTHTPTSVRADLGFAATHASAYATADLGHAETRPSAAMTTPLANGGMTTPLPGGLPSAPAVTALPAVASTQFVASTPGVPAVALEPTPLPRRNWQKYAFMVVLLAVIAVIVISRQSPSPPSNAVPVVPMPATQPVGPQTIRAEQPPLTNRKMAKDWSKVIEKLQRHELDEAREKLDEFERKHGESPETRSLASQLDSLPPAYRGEDD